MRLVWFSEIKWTYVKNRHQQLIERFPPNWRILFIETYVLGRPNAFRPRRDGRVTYVTIPFLKGTPYPGLNLLQSLLAFRWLFSLVIWLWVKVIFLLTGFSTPRRVFISSNIYFAGIIRFLRRRRVVYDCNDYPMGFPGALPFAQSYFEKMIRTADVVACVSRKLREDVARYKTDAVHVIGNGVDFALFSGTGGLPPPADVAGLPRPIVLYCGAISEWFNLDLVVTIARHYPAASVVVVGPILTPTIRQRLSMTAAIPNLFFLGQKAHADLPAYIHQAGVCLIPFVKDPLIARFNPNKLYEYLACGKPVVTLDYTEEIVELQSVVHMAHDDIEFVDQVGTALAHPPKPAPLIDVARANDWKMKADAMTRLLLEPN